MHQSLEQRQSICASSADFSPQQGGSEGRPIVLDTNVALDWLVFRDPAAAPIGAGIEGGQWRWVATVAMRAEFTAVLARPEFQRWAAQGEAIAAGWARWASIVDPPAAAPGVLRCADADDQMFIDLALALQPSRLFSRDREVLRLARRALPLGVTIAAPASGALVQDSLAVRLPCIA
jgi:uncharacterized protein